MTLSTYLLYLAAVALLVLSPGPTMLMSMTNAVNHGAPKAMASACGSVTAVLGVMVLSSLGLGALLSASEIAFTVFKSIGAAYLIYLGVKTFSSTATTFEAEPQNQAQGNARHRSAKQLYAQGLLVGASNPKALLFFAAFFPQFLNPAETWAPQFAVLALTFIAVEFSVLTLCTLFAARIAPWLRREGRARWFNRGTGSLFAGMGVVLLTLRRHT
jgi:threonine/homoserine/homoserine lactone efflux protein